MYCFLHVPKTGGALFMRNMENSLPARKFLRVNYTYKQFYYHHQAGKICFYTGDKGDFERVLSMSKNIHVAAGHDLYYGIHEAFSNPAKYIMTLREPIARTLSLYNYQRDSYDYHLQREGRLPTWGQTLLARLRRVFLLNGKIPTFEEWLEQIYNQTDHFNFTMTRFLSDLGYCNLDLFYFVGLTETLDQDMLFLSNEMKINRYWADRNASRPHVVYASLKPETREKIRKINEPDFDLYERGKKANAQFKKAHPRFRTIVRIEQIKKWNLYPYEMAIQTLKKLKAQLVLVKKRICASW